MTTHEAYIVIAFLVGFMAGWGFIVLLLATNHGKKPDWED